jgi:hypothetical protein
VAGRPSDAGRRSGRLEADDERAVAGELDEFHRPEVLDFAFEHRIAHPSDAAYRRHECVEDVDDASAVLVAGDGTDADSETALEHGNGLGLWFVNWIVTRYGGSFGIEADDSETTGTVATVRLPAVAADASLDEAERPPTTLFR